MKKNSYALILCSTVLSNLATAGTMGSVNNHTNNTWVATLSAGPTWEKGGKTRIDYLAPNIAQTYTAKQNTHALFDGELFLGLQRNIGQEVLGQLGIAINATSSAKLSGEIWDDADPDFNNFTYDYSLQHTAVALKGKLLADRGFYLIPWVSASVGIGFNNAHSFDNLSVLFEALPHPNFRPNTQVAFTYTLGAGVQKMLNNNWQVGAGYEFSDWGKSHLGSAAQQTLSTPLALKNLYTNGVLFNVTYLA